MTVRGRLRFVFLLLVGGLPTGMAACGEGSPPSAWTAELRVAPTPPGVGSARVVVRVTGPEGPPASGTPLRIRGELPHPDVPPVEVMAREVEPGLYEVPDHPFPAPGAWTLTAILGDPDGALLEWSFPVRAVDLPGQPGAGP